MNRVLIDLGSSTVKVYLASDNTLKHLFSSTISFKDGFSEEDGISATSKELLLNIINKIKREHHELPVKIFATAIFRKLFRDARTKLLDEIFQNTGFYLNIISQDLENFYLQTALTSRCNISKNILLVNIGGASTELVVMGGNNVLERQNIDIGVGTINTNFPQINNQYSNIHIKSIIEYISPKLPSLWNTASIAFYNGGELTYMKLTGYSLEDNRIFKDNDHPYTIDTKYFKERNEEIFHKVSLEELECSMPQNPKWMLGARACSAIAQAIFTKYKIKEIIPSDSNLINGVSRQEFRKVTISGSFRKHLDYILAIKDEIEESGATVLSPRFIKPKNSGEEFVVFAGEEGKSPLDLERHHLCAIDNSDALIVCDPEGYVGASALIEIGYANALGKRVIFTEKPAEFMLNTLPAEIGL